MKTSAIALTLVFSAHGQCAVYPDKPIRLILPYPPGGGTDLIARPLAQRLSEQLGQQVVVDNRGGANGNIGMQMAARAQPDGYTIVLALTAQLAINPAFYPKLPYEPEGDYEPIAYLGSAPYLLTANPGVTARTISELIALAKARPGTIAFASSGTGGIPHLAGELLKNMAGIDMIHVAYKGGGPAIIDVIGGQVQLNFAVISAGLPHMKSGKLRAIAVTSAQRFPVIGNVPAIAETLSGYEISTWYGVLAPAHTPQQVVRRLNAEIVKCLTVTEMNNYLLGNGFAPDTAASMQLREQIRRELVKWAKIVRDSGVSAE